MGFIDFEQILKDAESAIKTSVTTPAMNDPEVQKYIAKSAEQSAVQKTAEVIQKNWRTYLPLGIAVLVVGAGIFWYMGRKS